MIIGGTTADADQTRAGRGPHDRNQRNGRGPDAGRTIEFKETDAGRTRGSA
eukprot:gene21142-biopygen13172